MMEQAYVALIREEGWVIGLATENKDGYIPVPLGPFPTEAEADVLADELNRQHFRLSRARALMIALSSMHPLSPEEHAKRKQEWDRLIANKAPMGDPIRTEAEIVYADWIACDLHSEGMSWEAQEERAQKITDAIERAIRAFAAEDAKMTSWVTIKDKNGPTASGEVISSVFHRMSSAQREQLHSAERVSVCGSEVLFEMPDGVIERDRLVGGSA